MKLPIALLVSLLLASSLAHAAADTTDYAIQFTRTSAVGDRYHVVASGSDEQTATASVDNRDMPPKNDRLAVELVADCEVLALTPDGRAVKLQLVVQKLFRTAPGRPVDLLPAGTIVIIERVKGRTTYTQGGGAFPPLIGKAFETAGMSLAAGDRVNDDAIFGTKERKKVGDSWPINAEAAAADMAKKKIPANATNVRGSTTLAEVMQLDNQPVLRIVSTVTIRDVKPLMPPGVEIETSEFTGNHAILLPVDSTQRARQIATALDMEVTAGGMKDGHTMAMRMTKKTSYEMKFTSN